MKAFVMLLRCLGWTAITFKIVAMVVIIWWGDSLLLRAGIMAGAMVLMAGLEELVKAMVRRVTRQRAVDQAEAAMQHMATLCGSTDARSGYPQ